MEQLGGTEMQNRKRLLQLGVTEKFKSVAEIENLDQLSDLGVTGMDDESGTPSAPHTEWFESDLMKFCDVAWIEFETRKAQIAREGS